jgi:RHS repeat-associated protein
MSQALKQLDLLIGIDIHLMQFPNGVVLPLPNPYVGMLFEPLAFLPPVQIPKPADFLPTLHNALEGTKKGLEKADEFVLGWAADYIPGASSFISIPQLPEPPKIGVSVKVNGLPRVVGGTKGKAMGTHIPLPPVAKFLKSPKNESEMYMGSATVSADGDPMSYWPLPVLSCSDIGLPVPKRKVVPGKKPKVASKSLMLPTTQAIPVPMGRPVLVGGAPSILGAFAESVKKFAKKEIKGALKKRTLAGFRKTKAGKKVRFFQKASYLWKKKVTKKPSEWLHKKAEAALNTLRIPKSDGWGKDFRNAVDKKLCDLTGHPVDVATGKVLTDAVDFELPGPLPLRWERIWFSTSIYRGPLGHGWHHAYDEALLEVPDVAVLFRKSDGRVISFFPVIDGEEQFDRAEKISLSRDERGYAIRDAAGITHRFRQHGGVGDGQRLSSLEDQSGNRIIFTYDRRGALATIIDAAGRQLNVATDDQRRIVSIDAPHPSEPEGRLTLVKYAYDHDDNLVEARDGRGQAFTFTYDGHLLTRETNRNGLSFYFEYDGKNQQARCVRTWGDGGIYDHKIRYEQPAPGITEVTDSLGAITLYCHRGGTVWKRVNALGHANQTQRNEFGEVEAETDELGQQTTYVRDEHGNPVMIKQPDGAVVRMVWSEDDQLLSVCDAVGGIWRWTYDEKGRLLSRTDPAERTLEYRWDERRLTSMKDPTGQETWLEYDTAGNLTRLRASDRTSSRWEYDRLGRCVRAIDARGNVQERQHDALGRVVRVHEPDGNVRELAYDGEGNVTHAKDRQHDVKFAYVGMGRIAARTEAGTTVSFEYDTEERLTGIRNEHGFVYRFVLGPTGEVEEEHGFDGLRRRYKRDPAGRVLEVERPSQAISKYKHDRAGRVVGVEHADGSKEAFKYRADGQLMGAKNATAELAFERDLLGRITKEVQGDDWVASAFDVAGLRTRLWSSKGLVQEIERDAMGDVLAVRAGKAEEGADPAAIPALPREGAGDPAAPFEARFQRDALGLELERALPGGVRARWERDKLGRPLKQEVWSGERLVGGRQYTWDINDRLRMVVDALKGPVQYKHDAVGNLAGAIYEDGRVDLRMPDAVGNLFRTEDRRDRKYGAAGQLLESRGPDGVTTYEYDAEGNLAGKIEPGDRTWRYEWNAAGMLARVVRPDGASVEFGYDPLGRRLWKKFRGKITKWVWDGNVPLHEWVEADPDWVEPETAAPDTGVAEVAATTKSALAMLTSRPAQGPPRTEGTSDNPITWLFEPESFSLLAKLVDGERYSIITDHLGTPTVMLDATGAQVWSADIDVYGDLRNVEGDRGACPFRWPGQYEDEETGLYYNRFRYYEPSIGTFACPDPVRLLAGLTLFAYAHDPLTWADPTGLTECNVYHGTDSARKVAGVLSGIDPKYLRRENRFGEAFYVAERPDTALAELRHHSVAPTHGIRFRFNREKARILDLTDPSSSEQLGYKATDPYTETAKVRDRALASGYNVIRYESVRAPGNVNLAVIADFNDILAPQMVSPI